MTSAPDAGTADVEASAGKADAPTDDPFIAPVAAEDDEAALFSGDTGTLPVEVRQTFVRLLTDRYVSAARQPALWRTLLANQGVLESRLHDLFVHLVVDHDRGLAYKRQVREAAVEVPVLLRDTPYTRTETVILVYLRAEYQREQGVGSDDVRVDLESVEEAVLSFLPAAEPNRGSRQKEVRSALARLVRDGLLAEESQGRYRVLPVIEVVLSVPRLEGLVAWLTAQGSLEGDDGTTDQTDDGADDRTDLDEDAP
jgi:uncharacterized protein DUF4194